MHMYVTYKGVKPAHGGGVKPAQILKKYFFVLTLPRPNYDPRNRLVRVPEPPEVI